MQEKERRFEVLAFIKRSESRGLHPLGALARPQWNLVVPGRLRAFSRQFGAQVRARAGARKDKKDSKHLAMPATPNLGGYTKWVRSRAPTGMLVPPAEGVQPTKAADWDEASRIKLEDLGEIRKI